MEEQLFFDSSNSFRKWLVKNHHIDMVLWVCYYKKNTGKLSVSWPESVEEALCFGWIDGLRKTIDAESYRIRFTQRRKNSIWSPTNLATIKRLIAEKRIKPLGLEIYRQRKKGHSELYDNIKKDWVLQESYLKELKSDSIGWEYYKSLSPTVKKQVQRWVMSAKKEETRNRRLNILLESCSEQLLVPPLRWTKNK
jgi:uncharacterized protein YdeI (YjbR/CyaY-like superfamily)